MGFFCYKELEETERKIDDLLTEMNDFGAKNFDSSVPDYVKAVMKQLESGEFDMWRGDCMDNTKRIIDFETFMFGGCQSIRAWFHDADDFDLYSGLLYVARELGKDIYVYLSENVSELKKEHSQKLIDEGVARFCDCDCDAYVIVFDEKHSICKVKKEDGGEYVLISANRHKCVDSREIMRTYLTFFAEIRKRTEEQ